MYKISPSQIGLLMECPRCLWLYYRKRIERPRGIFPSLPSGVDGVLKNYFDEFRKIGKLPPEIEGKIEGKLFGDIYKLNNWRSNRIGLQAEFPELDIFLKGAIDDLLVAQDGKYILFDFKTRGYPAKEDSREHYQNQLNLYGLLFQKNNLPPADFGYLLFFSPLKYENGSFQFLNELVKMQIDYNAGYELLKKAKNILDGEIPEARSECQYCIYKTMEITN